MGMFSRQAGKEHMAGKAGSADDRRRVKDEICFPDPSGRWITLKQYADERGLSYNGALWRFNEWGVKDPRFWDGRRSPSDIKLGGATRADVTKVTWLNVTKTVREWADFLGITVQAMWQRLKKWGVCERTFRPKRASRGNKAAQAG